ncbi:MAG: sigma 54-interacting transcriptional regulator [Magnetococcales bacterium]|nr:sigma 54-interacting transcriptional regulator [Magnetococcales bacterium]
MPQRARILVVREEADLPVPIEAWLSGTNFLVRAVRGRDSAVEALTSGAFDLVLVGVRAHGPDPEWLGRIQRLSLGAPLLLIGGKPASEGVTVLVFDHLIDPVTSTRLLKSIHHALEFRAVSGWRHLLRQQLDAVLDHVEEIVILVDENMTVLRANDVAHRLCGFPTDTSGRPVTIADLTPCGPDLVEIFQRVFRERQSIRREERSCPFDPSQSYSMQVSAAPIWGNAGRFDGVVFVVHNHARRINPQPAQGRRAQFHGLIGQSARMAEIYSLIEEVGGMDTTILITGESGTGKELIAEALHNESRRRHGPLVKVNCSGLSESLLEDELFGHVKGAFTGAIKNRAGRFQMADKGTIFLDEIGDIPHSMQTRLLRIIQEREFEPVGESRTVKVDVRIIAATNRDLPSRIQEGEFREDLYFRLKVVEIHLPSLRDRHDDVPLLTRHFLQKFNRKHTKEIQGFDAAVMDLFLGHPWPGNVRELENVIEHAFAFCHQSRIRMEHLPKEYQGNGRSLTNRSLGVPVATELPAIGVNAAPTSAGGQGETDGEALSVTTTGSPLDPTDAAGADEKQRILQALEAEHWKKVAAAKRLGMSRSNLYRKMELYKIV